MDSFTNTAVAVDYDDDYEAILQGLCKSKQMLGAKSLAAEIDDSSTSIREKFPLFFHI